MGMFDNLICEYPLPNIEAQNERFQTKDFNCELDDYKIGSDGQLYKNDNNPWFGTNDKSNPDWILINSTECVTFYTSTGKHGVDFKWYQYKALFNKGKLITLEKDFEQ